MQTLLAKREELLTQSSAREVLAMPDQDCTCCPCQQGFTAVPDTQSLKDSSDFCFSASSGVGSLCPGTERTNPFQQAMARICILLNFCI